MVQLRIWEGSAGLTSPFLRNSTENEGGGDTMPTVNDTLEFELNRASVFLGELAAENIDPGVEPGTWGAFQDRADTFFESVLCPSPANKNFKENYAKWKALMHSKLDMLGAHGSLGKVWSDT